MKRETGESPVRTRRCNKVQSAICHCGETENFSKSSVVRIIDFRIVMIYCCGKMGRRSLGILKVRRPACVMYSNSYVDLAKGEKVEKTRKRQKFCVQ